MTCFFEISYLKSDHSKGRVESGKLKFSEAGDWSDSELGLEFSYRFEQTSYGTQLVVPAISLRENGENKFASIAFCNPDFLGEEGDGGEFFIPWASGYLTRTAGHKPNEYILGIFNERSWQVAWGNMPLFGFFRNDHCRIGLIEGGKLDADLRLRTAWGKQKIYSLDPVFNIRETWAEPALDEDMTVLFTEFPGNWKEAAKWYRQYNLDIRKLKSIAERIKDEPDLEYSTKSLTVRCRMAVKPLPVQILEQRPENEPKPRVFLTYDNVKTIAEEFRKQGLGPAEFCLVGWNHGGHDGAFPQLFPTADGCGSEDALRGLIDRINELGYRISLHDNYYDGYTLARNFNLDDACHSFGEYGGPMIGGGKLGGGQAYRVCPQKAVEYAKNNLPEVSRRLPGLRGPYFVDVVSIIPMRSCSHPQHRIDHRDNSEYYKQILKLQHDTFGLSMSEGGRDWALPELDRTYMIYNLDKPAEEFCDEHIPFFQMVYHGIILYNNCRLFINTYPGSREYIENLAWGGLPILYYHHIFNPTWSSAAGWSLDLTFESPEKLAKDAAIFKRMSEDVMKLAPTQQAFMEDFIRHENGLTETVYSNGMSLYANTGNKELTAPDGEIVPARGYIYSNKKMCHHIKEAECALTF